MGTGLLRHRAVVERDAGVAPPRSDASRGRPRRRKQRPRRRPRRRHAGRGHAVLGGRWCSGLVAASRRGEWRPAFPMAIAVGPDGNPVLAGVAPRVEPWTYDLIVVKLSASDGSRMFESVPGSDRFAGGDALDLVLDDAGNPAVLFAYVAGGVVADHAGHEVRCGGWPRLWSSDLPALAGDRPENATLAADATGDFAAAASIWGGTGERRVVVGRLSATDGSTGWTRTFPGTWSVAGLAVSAAHEALVALVEPSPGGTETQVRFARLAAADGSTTCETATALGPYAANRFGMGEGIRLRRYVFRRRRCLASIRSITLSRRGSSGSVRRPARSPGASNGALLRSLATRSCWRLRWMPRATCWSAGLAGNHRQTRWGGRGGAVDRLRVGEPVAWGAQRGDGDSRRRQWRSVLGWEPAVSSGSGSAVRRRRAMRLASSTGTVTWTRGSASRSPDRRPRVPGARSPGWYPYSAMRALARGSEGPAYVGGAYFEGRTAPAAVRRCTRRGLRSARLERFRPVGHRERRQRRDRGDSCGRRWRRVRGPRRRGHFPAVRPRPEPSSGSQGATDALVVPPDGDLRSVLSVVLPPLLDCHSLHGEHATPGRGERRDRLVRHAERRRRVRGLARAVGSGGTSQRRPTGLRFR